MTQQPTSPAHPAIDVMQSLLHALRADMAEVKTDVRGIRERIRLLESQYASVSRCLDRLSGDVERVKVRLDLHSDALT